MNACCSESERHLMGIGIGIVAIGIGTGISWVPVSASHGYRYRYLIAIGMGISLVSLSVSHQYRYRYLIDIGISSTFLRYRYRYLIGISSTSVSASLPFSFKHSPHRYRTPLHIKMSEVCTPGGPAFLGLAPLHASYGCGSEHNSNKIWFLNLKEPCFVDGLWIELDGLWTS